MKIEKRSIKKHLFICCNKKVGKESCSEKDPETLLQNLRMRIQSEDLWDEYKVTKSGCLGPCSEGISATLYPDNLMITQLTIEDEEELYQLLLS